MGYFVYLEPNPSAFSRHMVDSNQLSAIRGGSAAMLFGPKWFGGQLASRFGADQTPVDWMSKHQLFRGASTGGWLLDQSAGSLERVNAILDEIWADLKIWADLEESQGHFSDLGGGSDHTEEKSNEEPQILLEGALSVVPFVAVAVPINLDQNGKITEDLGDLITDTRAHWEVKAGEQLDELAFIVPGGGEACHLTGRVATTTGTFPTDDGGVEEVPLSKTAARRLQFGRFTRSTYFAQLAADGDLPSDDEIEPRDFATNFQEQLSAISLDSLRESTRARVENKMAVFYADFNKLSTVMLGLPKARMGSMPTERIEGWQGSWDLYKENSRRMREDLQVEGLLKPWYAKLLNLNTTRDILPFETLMFGGDEMLFVMPASIALQFAEFYFGQIEGWELEIAPGKAVPITVSAGLVICDRKTPIRRAKALAQELADEIKETCHFENEGPGKHQQKPLSDFRSLLQIEVVHSVDVPQGYLKRQREGVVGQLDWSNLSTDEAKAEAELLRYCINCSCDNGFATFIKKALSLQGDDTVNQPGASNAGVKLPRSQIHAALEAARQRNNQNGKSRLDSEEGWKKIDDYLDRVLGLTPDDPVKERFRLFGSRETDQYPDILNLVMMAKLWDYLECYDTLDARLKEPLSKGDEQ